MRIFFIAAIILLGNCYVHAQNIIALAGVGYGMINAGFSGDGGPASLAQLNVPFDLARDQAGNIYFTDKLNNRIRKISTSDTITTIAGTGVAGNGPDGGQAILTDINGPSAIAIDADGNIYFTDLNSQVKKINTAGIITTIAGTGTAGFSGDGGLATAAELNYPADIALDDIGNIYLADEANNRVRKINTSGIITTIAGDGTAAYAGDGGLATAAELNAPEGLALDANGNLYIADMSNHRIRKIAPTGIITTIAGDGNNNYIDGPALQVSLNLVTDLALDAAGNLYFAESPLFAAGSKLRVLSNNNISTVISGASFGGTGDGGPVSQAQINTLRGINIDAEGDFYLADPDDSRILFVCANNTLPGASAVYYKSGMPDNSADPFTAMQHCNIICSYHSLNVNPVNEQIAFKVKIDANVNSYQGMPYVQRHYDVEPLNNAATDTATLTLYYTQADFDAYNAAAGNFYNLPTGPNDAAGIAALRVQQYHGVATDSTPAGYPGNHVTIDPVDANIHWNAIYNIWEVTFDVAGFSGFFVTTDTIPLSVSNINTVEQGLHIYPSVTDGMITLLLSDNSLLGSNAILMTVEGQRVKTIPLNHTKQQTDISDLAAGLYLLKTEDGTVYKIIKQ